MIEEPFDPDVEDEIAYLEWKKAMDEYRPIYRASFISLFDKDPFILGE